MDCRGIDRAPSEKLLEERRSVGRDHSKTRRDHFEPPSPQPLPEALRLRRGVGRPRNEQVLFTACFLGSNMSVFSHSHRLELHTLLSLTRAFLHVSSSLNILHFERQLTAVSTSITAKVEKVLCHLWDYGTGMCGDPLSTLCV